MARLPVETAAVLAGGFGTRLRPLLPDTPKPLAPVAGRPFLFWVFDRLIRAGVRRAVLLTGYRGELLEERLGRAYRGLALEYSREDRPLDTAGALRNALPLFRGETVLAVNGDSLAVADLGAFVRWFASAPFQAALLAVESSDAGRFGSVRFDSGGRAEGFAEKDPAAGRGVVNAGVYLFSPEALEALPSGRPASLEREVFPDLAGRGLLGVHPCEGALLDIGTPKSYQSAASFIAASPELNMFAARQAGPDTKLRLGVGVLVTDAAGRILLERRADCGLWGLPGGRVDPGESLSRAAVREVFEETGLCVEVTGLAGVYSEPDVRVLAYPEGDTSHIVDVVLTARVLSGELRASPESLELAFFTPQTLPEGIAPPARDPVNDYFQGRGCVLG